MLHYNQNKTPHHKERRNAVNANVNTVNTDASNEAAQTLADMFAGTTIEDYSINGGTIIFNVTGCD